jgi:hypothetical protein
MKYLIWIAAISFLMASCRPASTPMPPTETPLPTATVAVPPTNTPVPPSTLTMTIKDESCTLEGPSVIPHVVLTINLVMDEQKPTESGYALITLKEGKTIEDLKAWPSAAQPPWVNFIHGVREFTNGIHTYAYNYGNVTTDQTLYLVCFRTDPGAGVVELIGRFGPIEVK